MKIISEAKIRITLVLTLCCLFSAAAARASGADPSFLSIHLASFKSLENTNRHVNSLKHRGKVVFWKKVTLAGKGTFYRVYVGRFADWASATAYWNALKTEGAVSYFGIHRFSELPLAETVKMPVSKDGLPAPKQGSEAKSPRSGPRFVDNGDGTVTDHQTGLMWARNGWRFEFLSAVNWWDAQKRCRGFNLAGYGDWRLPDIDEWRSLIDPQKEYPALVEGHPFVNIIAHMPYWTRSDFTYGAEKGPANQAFTVMMFYGSINHQSKKDSAFILPVRSVTDRDDPKR